MSEWIETPLSELLVPGGNISYGIVQPGAHDDDGVPVLRVSDIRNGRISTAQPLRVSSSVETAHARTRLKGGELLLTLVGTVGETAVVPNELAGWNVARAVAVIPVRDDVGAYWLRLALSAPNAQEMIRGRQNTTVQATLNLKDVAQLPILMPTLAERAAIAKIIGDLDDKIELNRRMNETLEAMARAIFQSWFVDFDPVRAKASGESADAICQRLGLTPELLALFPDDVVETQMGPTPKGWCMEVLGELCERVAIGPFGSDIKTDNFVSEGVPIIRGGNLKDGFGGGDFVFLTNTKADALRNANAFPGDIVLTHRGTLGQVGLIPSDAEFPRYVISQSQMLLSVAKTKTTARYVYEFLRSPQGLHALLSNTSQVGVPAISRPTTSLKAIPILNPPMTVLQAYDAVTGLLFFAIGANSKATDSLSKIRNTLLPRLLSGELEVFD